MVSANVENVNALRIMMALPASAGGLMRAVVPRIILCASVEGTATVIAVNVMRDTSLHDVRTALDALTLARPNCKEPKILLNLFFQIKPKCLLLKSNSYIDKVAALLTYHLNVIIIVFRNCIECLGFESGPFEKNCSVTCSSIQSKMVDEFTITSKQCQQKDSQGCWIKFNLKQLVGKDNYRAEILKKRGKVLMKHKLVVNVFFNKSLIFTLLTQQLHKKKQHLSCS